MSGSSPDIGCFLLNKIIASMQRGGGSNTIVLFSARKAEGEKFCSLLNSVELGVKNRGNISQVSLVPNSRTS